jgi:cation transporter-like permease
MHGFPRLVILATRVIKDNVLVRIIESHKGSIGLFKVHKTASVKVLLSTPVSISFGLQLGIVRYRFELHVGPPEI